MECICGFKFSEPGEFRDFDCFLNADFSWGYICPDCGKKYVDGIINNQIVNRPKKDCKQEGGKKMDRDLDLTCEVGERVAWSTLSGETYHGTIQSWDSNVAIVLTDDGEIKSVEC
jgi:hypothetical protein